MKEKIFVYGSLKKGCYNHKPCGLDKSKSLGNTMIVGYKLYSLGSYPCIVSSKDDSIVYGELYEVDEETFKRIQNMEIGARYIEVEYIEGDMKFKFWAKKEVDAYFHKSIIESEIWREK